MLTNLVVQILILPDIISLLHTSCLQGSMDQSDKTTPFITRISTVLIILIISIPVYIPIIVISTIFNLVTITHLYE